MKLPGLDEGIKLGYVLKSSLRRPEQEQSLSLSRSKRTIDVASSSFCKGF